MSVEEDFEDFEEEQENPPIRCLACSGTVSYTHLTLPTILLV